MQKKIKICIILPSHWSANMGGAEYQVKCMLDELEKDSKFEIYYLTRYSDPDFTPAKYNIRNTASRIGINRFGFFFDALNIIRLLKEIKPDLIYQRVGCAYTGISAFYAKKHCCPMAWHISHDLDVMPFEKNKNLKAIFRYIDKKFLEYGIKTADYIIAQTFLQAEYLKKYYHRKPNKIIYNFHSIPQKPIKKSFPLQIVWIANLKTIKQPQVFIQLCQDLVKYHTHIKCVMIGSPVRSNREWQISMENQINAIAHLEYKGSLPIDRVNKILDESHLLINTSIKEGFSNTFIQAWMRNVPVISLNCDPDSLISSKKLGFFAAGSYLKMLNKVEELIEHPEKITELGKNSRKFALKHNSNQNLFELKNFLVDLVP